MHKGIHIGTVISLVVALPRNDVGAALLVDVILLVIRTWFVFGEITKTVHRLRASLRSALLEGMHIRAAVTAVGDIGRNLVDPAAPVLVVIRVMVALAIRTPSANAVHGLAAFASRTLNLVVLVRAFLAVQVSLDGHLVGVAALVLVAIHNMSAGTVRSPLALAIHGLAAARLSALLKSILMRASESVVQSNLRHLVHTAALVLVVTQHILALIIGTPSAHAINRLRTPFLDALLQVMRVRAGMAVVLGIDINLVGPAPLVDMIFLEVSA